MSNKTLILLSAAALLAACNKNEVITPDEADGGFRPATAASSPYQDAVYEYMPAPGQFINDVATTGFTGKETTRDAALAYAYGRLSNQRLVSLGAFGGYIVVGFDHSIANSGGYDIAIRGNAIDSSNEPGIVWVMQDANGNGLPDDVWYELRGSETGSESTSQDYSVTYYRPAAPKMPVKWTGSDGQSGEVEYLDAYHSQDYYYPAWAGETYTLTGTRLQARNYQDPSTFNWINPPYSWGYVDNLGSDQLGLETGQWNGFKISNAMRPDGSPASLDYVDFVKVQQGVMAQSGWIGENSCEVCCVADYKLLLAQ